MSANGSDDDEIPGREIAYRLFAAEYDDAEFSYAESDEERAPNYVVSPTGARLNRMFAVGTLTEITSVNDEMLRARIVDPTGAFVVYAGQYQPEALAVLEQLAPPAFIAVSGKARTFEPEDGDRVYTSIRPESIAEVDAATRDRWVVSTAEQTLDRIGTYAEAATVDAHGDALTDALHEAGVESGLAAGIPLAQDHYGTTPAYLAALRDCATEAVEVVADERDEVSGFSIQPDASGSGDVAFDTLTSLAAVDGQDLDLEAHTPTAPAETGATDEAGEQDPEPEPEPIAATADASDETAAAAGTATTSEPETAAVEFDESAGDSSTSPADAEDESGTAVEAETESESEPESASVPESESESELEAEAESESEPVAETESEIDSESDSESEPEPESEPAPEGEAEAAADSDDALGDFDGGDPGMYEMDEEEREQIEDEFGTEFTTGAEVDEPGEADIDVPSDGDDTSDEPEPASDESPTGEASTAADDELGEPPASTVDDDAADEPAADTNDETDEADETVEPDETADAESDADQTESDSDDASDEPADEPAEDVDLQEYVVDTMQDLDDGTGADRTELVDTVAADTGASEADVEDAIQDALMGGQCYEPDDETLKAI
ncbi:rpa-associated protein [Natrialba magadii ATCC 43099]|uniref:Rpa-associated protein n=1 Tax=Natrialba magadii (strain ATCC 43099 / DSM 3394 / CCM 3739 / CIP 104546 / IAM 13178 / JCM 8861 / NBRC 102185 / NCIMB 2190 / MS3) TaxID=547559 RepID=D3SR79_NATMM|nr:hypothetical protein [Natrialba magadii]ADD06635.1 rpa-associated protein [Natrialba magadii ATCC 43099]ELY31904.1 hypothetical protein C500_04983 [Natrialba magadii ATCC 43099]